MTYMFVYPLFGTLVYALDYMCIGLMNISSEDVPFYRFACNLFNSGIAAMVVASTLIGVLEIAGTASVYTIPLKYFGIALASVGAIALFTSRLLAAKHRLGV